MIIQTENSVQIFGKRFPAQFLIDKGFPDLPPLTTNLTVYKDRSVYSDGNSVVGELSESDRLNILKWCEEDKINLLHQEYLADESYPDPLPDSLPKVDWAGFTKQSLKSLLYRLARSNNSQESFNALMLVISLVNNPDLKKDSETFSEAGLLRQNLQALVNTIDDMDLPIAIDQFNQILKETLKVNWILV